MTIRQYFDGFFDVISKIDTVGEIETAERWIVEFYEYFDALAAANPHRFHHVYEWYQVGDAPARLFELNIVPSGFGTIISYEFKESVTPNANGQFFPRKAWVMESGEEVTFETDKPVPIGDEEFRVGRFTFKPGGDATTGAFETAFRMFFAEKKFTRTGGRVVIRPTTYNKMSGTADGVKLYDNLIGK